MKKLFNTKPGSLKEKFEGLEEVPSLKSWRNLEAELAAINAGISRKRRRKRAVYFMAVASIGLVLFMVSSLTFDQTNSYQLRQSQAGDLNFQTEQDDWKLKTTVNSGNQTNMLASSVTNGNVTSNGASTYTINQGEANHPQDLNSNLKNINSQFALSKIDGAPYGEVPTEDIVLTPEHLTETKKRTKLSQRWRINVSGGQDITRQALAPRREAAFINSGGNGKPLQSWSFTPYTHQLPVVLSAGVERRLGKRFSTHFNVDYQMMRAVAGAPYRVNNRTAIKKGRLDQFGLAVGVNAEVLRTNKISAYVGVEAWAAHATNARTEIIQLNHNSLEATVSQVRLTPSSILSARANVGLRYKVTEKVSVSGGVVATKPIHNYINELNVYNNGQKYIPGLRWGLSIAI